MSRYFKFVWAGIFLCPAPIYWVMLGLVIIIFAIGLITNRMVVNQLINELHDRDKEIILLRFFKEKTQTEVAKILGISQVQVSRIARKILNEMKAKLTSA
mgnify:CR=1 FL=1